MGVKMAVRFQILSGLVAMGNAGRHCGSHAQCLTSLYQARIAVLKKRYESLNERGPF